MNRSLVVIMLFVLFFSTTILFAEEAEMPNFKNPPVRYESQYGDELLIGDRSSKQLTFWFHLTGANYHVCSMAGTAIAEDKYTYATIADCLLRIKIVGDYAILIDDCGECQKKHCGSRASISGATFIKKKLANAKENK